MMPIKRCAMCQDRIAPLSRVPLQRRGLHRCAQPGLSRVVCASVHRGAAVQGERARQGIMTSQLVGRGSQPY